VGFSVRCVGYANGSLLSFSVGRSSDAVRCTSSSSRLGWGFRLVRGGCGLLGAPPKGSGFAPALCDAATCGPSAPSASAGAGSGDRAKEAAALAAPPSAAPAVHSPPPASLPATKLGEAVNVQRHVPQQTAHSARPPQTRRPQDQGASSKSGRSNGGVIALVIIVLIVVSALLIWMLYNSGILSGGSANETSTSSTPLVTEWVTTTVNPTGGNDEPVSQAPTGGTSLEPIQPSRGAPETQNAAPSEFMSEQNSNSEQRRRRDEDTYPSQYYQEPSSAASVPSVEQPTSEQNGASQ